MNNKLIVPILAILSGIISLVSAQTPWHTGQSIGGDGYWPIRVPLELHNSSDKAVAGEPVKLQIQPQDSTVALIGQSVTSLRVMDKISKEFVFELQDAQGQSKHSGKITAGDVLFIPTDIQARESTQVFVYAGNQQAWPVPDWMCRNFSNGGFEQGTSSPEGWEESETDASHRMTLDRTIAHNGKISARCDVDDKSEPTWCKYQIKGKIPLTPGRAYRFTAWVKAQNVKGRVGWFVHLHSKEGFKSPMGTVENESTFDWRQVKIDFTAPEDGGTFSCGTVLRGTGTAWYDDALLESQDKETAISVKVLPAERKTLRQEGSNAPWLEDSQWAWRVPLVVRNFKTEPAQALPVRFDARIIKNQAGKLLGFKVKPLVKIVDPQHPEWEQDIPESLAGDIQAKVWLEPETEKTVWLYLSKKTAVGEITATHQKWIETADNLMTRFNGSMEESDGEKPKGWICTETVKKENNPTARRVPGGVNGQWCLQMEVPQSVVNPGWFGWRQRIPVKPNTRYFLTGYLKTKDVDGETRIFGHLLGTDGQRVKGIWNFATEMDATYDSEWMRTTATVATPDDCAFIEIHLTMNHHGTVWHDAISLQEVESSPGITGQIQAREVQKEPLATWIVNPSVKVFQQDLRPPRATQKIEAVVCRNASEAIQIALRPTLSGQLKIHVTPLKGPKGTKLDALLYHVGYVPIDCPIGYGGSQTPEYYRLSNWPHGTDGWAGWWPDPLAPVNETGVKMEAGYTQPFFLDVHVPESATPGKYKGSIELEFNGEKERIPIKVTVWTFTQPVEKHLPILFDMRGKSIAGLSPAESAKTWCRFVSRYNLSPSFVPENPVFTYQNGEVKMDTEKFDTMASFIFDERHINRVYTPNFFYACGWAYQPKEIFKLKPFTPEYVKAWSDAYRMFVDHITKKGWRKKFVYYLSDEPDKNCEPTITALARIADIAKGIAADIPIYSSTWIFIPGLQGHLTQWGIGPHGSFPLDKVAECRAAGDHIWFTTDGHICIDTPMNGIEWVLPWLCFKHNIEAYEFWGVDWFTYNPWQYGWHREHQQSHDGKTFVRTRYPNGDGYMAYPGDEVGQIEPLPSIRLLAVRAGTEDYEMFLELRKFAERGNKEAQAVLDKICAQVKIPSPTRQSSLYLSDPDAFQSARKEAGEMLNRLLAK